MTGRQIGFTSTVTGKSRRSFAITILMAFMTLFAMPSAVATASPPADSGYWVTFVGPDHHSVLGERADGSGLTRLVSLNGGYISGPPAWSPDGARFAFSWQGGSAQQPASIVTDDIATGTSRVLTPGYSPAWSPDSARLAYAAPDGSLRVVGADGTESRVLDPAQPGTTTQQVCPVWSPNGRDVATLVASYPHNTRTYSIRVVRSDGGGLVGQVPDVAPSCPTWSADSQQVAFAKSKQYTTLLANTTLMVSHPDGSGVRELTGGGYCDGDSTPLWSHDGTRVLFQRLLPREPSAAEPYVPRCAQAQAGLWTVTPDGSRQLQLLARPGPPPTQAIPTQWSSDDRLISFVDEVATNCDGCDATYVAIVHGDGSGAHRLGTPSDGQPDSPWPTVAPVGTQLGAGAGQPTGTGGSTAASAGSSSPQDQNTPGVATPGVTTPTSQSTTNSSLNTTVGTMTPGSPERRIALPLTHRSRRSSGSWRLLALLTIVLLSGAVAGWQAWKRRQVTPTPPAAEP